VVLLLHLLVEMAHQRVLQLRKKRQRTVDRIVGEVTVLKDPWPIPPGGELRCRKEDPPEDQHLEDVVIINVAVLRPAVQKVVDLELRYEVTSVNT